MSNEGLIIYWEAININRNAELNEFFSMKRKLKVPHCTDQQHHRSGHKPTI